MTYSNTINRVVSLDSHTKKYDLIYADPPWKHDKLNFYEKKGVNKEVYPRMDIEDICNLPIQRIAKDNSILLLWVTSPFLKKAFQVVESWGFKYCTIAFVWIKTYKSGKEITGMGRYTRSACEFILLAKRGQGIHRKDTNIHQIIYSNLQDHSRKPEEIRRRIEKLFGEVERIELFARERFDGWDVFGNQIPKEKQERITKKVSVNSSQG